MSHNLRGVRLVDVPNQLSPFGIALRHVREQHKLSIQLLAQVAGITTTMLNTLEWTSPLISHTRSVEKWAQSPDLKHLPTSCWELLRRALLPMQPVRVGEVWASHNIEQEPWAYYHVLHFDIKHEDITVVAECLATGGQIRVPLPLWTKPTCVDPQGLYVRRYFEFVGYTEWQGSEDTNGLVFQRKEVLHCTGRIVKSRKPVSLNSFKHTVRQADTRSSTTNLGRALRDFRKQCGELLYDMAKALGYKSSYLNSIELGKIAVPDDFFDKLRNAYKEKITESTWRELVASRNDSSVPTIVLSNEPDPVQQAVAGEPTMPKDTTQLLRLAKQTSEMMTTLSSARYERVRQSTTTLTQDADLTVAITNAEASVVALLACFELYPVTEADWEEPTNET